MDHIRIIRRAFEITFRYRALWVFGILLALTTSRGGGNGGGSGSGSTGAQGAAPSLPNVPNFHWPQISGPVWSTVAAAVLGFICLVLVLAVILAVIRYVSLNASIKMVDNYEASGEQVSVGTGFRWGWARGAFRLWLVDLIFGLVGFIAVILVLLVAAAPLLLWLTRDQTAGIIGTVITIGLALLFILILVVIGALVGLWKEMIQRVVVLEGLGVFESFSRGWQMVRRRPWDVIIMGLILFGIGLLFAIVMIPVILILLMLAGVTGGLPGLVVYLISNAITHQGALPIILGVLVGLPIFLLILIIPSLIINGLYEIFTLSTWTLTYRELLALEAVQPPSAPTAPAAPAAPDVPASPDAPIAPAAPYEPLPPSEEVPPAPAPDEPSL